MLEREFNIKISRGEDKHEKELLFFVSEEDERERDGDEENLVVDPCHQNLLKLLDRILLAIAIFIAIVVCSAFTCIILLSNSKFNLHSYHVTLKSNYPLLPYDQRSNTTRNTIFLDNDIMLNGNLYFEWNSMELCNNLQRK